MISSTLHYLNPFHSTEKAEGMFASLIIVLPSRFQGGEVHVSHGDNKDIFDISPSSEFSISALAWYTDVIHEVKPVTSGYRLAISYNLVNPSRGLPAPHLPDMHTAVSGVQRVFRMWAKGEYDTTDSSGTIAYLLDHQYSDAGLEFTALKGKDAALISNIKRVAEKEGICLRLGSWFTRSMEMRVVIIRMVAGSHEWRRSTARDTVSRGCTIWRET